MSTIPTRRVVLGIVLVMAATGWAAPINYTDAPGIASWSMPSCWDQNYLYPGANDPGDTATIDTSKMTALLNVPPMGMITVKPGGSLLVNKSQTNTNTITILSGSSVEFRSGTSANTFNWNVILNDGAVWYGNLGGAASMNGTFTVPDGASVTIRHNGGSGMAPKLAGAITAPASSTITFEAATSPATGALYLAGDNSGMLARLNIKCPLNWTNTHSLGTNSSGPFLVPEGVQIGNGKYGTGNASLDRDLCLAGGTIYNATTSNYSATYAGQWLLQADLAITIEPDRTTAGWVYVDGPVSEDGTPRRIDIKPAGSQAASGAHIQFSNPNNDFSGGLSIDSGTVCIAAIGAQGRGPIRLTNGATLALGASPYTDWTLSNDLGGAGRCTVGDGSGNYTLTAAGMALTCGNDSTAATTFAVGGHLAFAQNAGKLATLNLDVIGQPLGPGIPTTVTNDALAVTGNVTGLDNAVLNVSISSLTTADVQGRLLPILTCANDLTGLTFGQINCPPGWQAGVVGGPGAMLLKLAPEGVNQAFLQVAPLLRFACKASDPDPAPQNLLVRNSGFAPSRWTASLRSPAPAWIKLASPQGSDGDSCQVSVDRQGVPLGSYSAWIDVTDPQAANPPQSVLVVLLVLPETLQATHSFTNHATRGTHPATIVTTRNGSAAGTITVDLSALPAGAQVSRAILVPHGPANTTNSTAAGSPLQIESADGPGVWLQTQAPRHVNLDCTAAVQRALQGDRTLRINIVSWPGWYVSQLIRLDVWCDQPVPAMDAVSGLQTVHRDGDTMLTYHEVEQPLVDYVVTGAQYTAAQTAINAGPEVRYRVYRSSVPIDATTIAAAQLVDEIGPLSGWNSNWAVSIATTTPILTLPIADDTLAPPGTGIYVRRAHACEIAYYAVCRSVDGQEDLGNWMPFANATAEPLAETAGAGMVLEWMQSPWWPGNIMHYFVRWESQPNWNLPNMVQNYLVWEPPAPASGPRGVSIYLHGAGGNIEDIGFGYEADNGALQVTANQIPSNYWYAFHENTGTIRPWANVTGNAGGVVRAYPAERIWSFVNDYVAKRWSVDRNHILLSGYSMGSCGASAWGVHAGDKLAYVAPNDGNHIPILLGASGWFGTNTWNCPFEETGETAWDYFDTCNWLRRHVATETPLITFANSRNDPYFAWNQAYLFAKALQETRRPHVFAWGTAGHQQWALMPGAFSTTSIGVRIDLNKTLPAFTYCSLDGKLGDGNASVGDTAGYLNAYLSWQPEDATDMPGRWEMTCWLIDAAPQGTCTVDITPRRCQAFKVPVGAECVWSNLDGASNAVIASGAGFVDANGLVTLPQVTVTKGKNRLRIALAGDVDGNGYVDVADVLALVDAFGTSAGDAGFNPGCDFSADGTIDVIDLLYLIDNWAK